MRNVGDVVRCTPEAGGVWLSLLDSPRHYETVRPGDVGIVQRADSFKAAVLMFRQGAAVVITQALLMRWEKLDPTCERTGRSGP
jgi:hypothetical protein